MVKKFVRIIENAKIPLNTINKPDIFPTVGISYGHYSQFIYKFFDINLVAQILNLVN